MPADPQAAPLAGLLSRELQILESLVVLLQREQDLLADGATELLTALSAEKSARSRELGQLAGARDGELARLGYPPARPGMEAWIAAPGRGSEKDWGRLLDLAGRARALNEANGRLIALHLQHNQQALNVLMAAVDQAGTYGPDGQHKAAAGGRSLGSA